MVGNTFGGYTYGSPRVIFLPLNLRRLDVQVILYEAAYRAARARVIELDWIYLPSHW